MAESPPVEENVAEAEAAPAEESAPAKSAGFPPYPPYATAPAPASVAEAIVRGNTLRFEHKSIPLPPSRAPPRPAKPKGPKVSNTKLSRRAMRAHARCLRRHGAVLTDRLEHMAKPSKRHVISMWREHAIHLAPERIARLRCMLDADEPFKPDQAYEYFINLRKTKKRNAAMRVNQIKKGVSMVCGDRRFTWARDATVAFARGIQQRLGRPGQFALGDSMLRLSDIILREVCGYMGTRVPSRACTHPKAKFMMEISDKVAVWIDEILQESDERMLLMDYDEDDDVMKVDAGEGGGGGDDDFLNMMGGGGLMQQAHPAYLKFTGDMLEAFLILTDSMQKKGNAQLLTLGKFTQTYKEGADELKETESFDAEDYGLDLANQLKQDLDDTAKPVTPHKLQHAMKDIVDICSKYLAQNAEYSKDKGPAFRLLIKTMMGQSKSPLYSKGKATRNFGEAAAELKKAKGLETDHDDPNLSQEIHSKLSKAVESVTPPDLKDDMKETLDLTSKYLSEQAVDQNERGPAFDFLIKKLEEHANDPFTPEHPELAIKHAAAYTLKSAPQMSAVSPDSATAPKFNTALHNAVDLATPNDLKADMNEVIDRCANYLSGFLRDRARMMAILLKTMKASPATELENRAGYSYTYKPAAMETETSPMMVPYRPVNDIAGTSKGKMAAAVAPVTPEQDKVAMASLVKDVGKHLSQPVALRSGVAGERYPLQLLTSVMESLGKEPLYKYKSYGQTFKDAAEVLKYAGPLESHDHPSAENLHQEILGELKGGTKKRLPPTVADDMHIVMHDASKHLAKHGMKKGKALEYLLGLMKKKGEERIAKLQGYEQSYNDAARRIEIAPSLHNPKVDKSAYETVRTKLNALTQASPNEEHKEHLPAIVEEASKFLAAPMPDTHEDKRRVLADLMARKNEELVAQAGLYKLTYKEGGEEIMQAPVGATTSHDASKKAAIKEKVQAVVPDTLQEMLAEHVEEGASHITDIVHGRGAAMEVIHEGLKEQDKEEFIKLKSVEKSKGQAAEMIEKAPHFDVQKPHPALMATSTRRIEAIDTKKASQVAKEHLPRTSIIASKYLAGAIAKEVDPNELASLSRDVESDADRRRREEEERRRKSAASGSETEEERRRRTAAGGSETEEERRRRTAVGGAETDEERRRREAEEERRRAGLGGIGESDQERKQALGILTQQLKAKGGEVLYQQPQTQLTHAQAADLISKPPAPVDNSVKTSGDTERLSKKLERKLSNLVQKATPPNMADAMQDVVIESSRTISEFFVSQNYKTLVRDALISEMQRKWKDLLIDLDGAAESFFFAAQRIKRAKDLTAPDSDSQTAYYLRKKMEEMIRCRSMARKLSGTMKDHIKDAAEFLSTLVTKPDEPIESYVSLLDQMEAAGDQLLIEGNIPKSYKESAAYLRQLTSTEDRLNRPDAALQSSVEGKLKQLMGAEASKGSMAAVITNSTKKLVSYIVSQRDKTEALKALIEVMSEQSGNIILRHGPIRKTYADAIALLKGKNTDQMRVPSAEPVVVRKIQLKLENLTHGITPNHKLFKFQAILEDVIDDTTMYLAVQLLQPHKTQVCKCMRNVTVQCELWCDETLRHVARPCCRCSRQVSAAELQDLSPDYPLRLSPGSSRAFAPGVQVILKQCPSMGAKRCPTDPPCPHAMMLYSIERDQPVTGALEPESPFSFSPVSFSPSGSSHADERRSEQGLLDSNPSASTSWSLHTPLSRTEKNPKDKREGPFHQNPTTMFAHVYLDEEPIRDDDSSTSSSRLTRLSGVSPVLTEQMTEWHAMMVSLMWNAQAWRDWIQESMDKALAYRPQAHDAAETENEKWIAFKRNVAKEALQWRQYNMFSRSLTLQLAIRYQDKEIVSPTRATVRTQEYRACQQEMLDVIEMFNRWTQWLAVVVKQADTLKEIPGGAPVHEVRWQHLKKKVEERQADWLTYNYHLKTCWATRYNSVITSWLPASGGGEPVWVVSAHGCVPVGAVLAGQVAGQAAWVARVAHGVSVLPAALVPARRAAICHTDGRVISYTKYQVMCNAVARWIPWNASRGACSHGVRVARDVLVGRVSQGAHAAEHAVGAVLPPHYRCHVVLAGRPVACARYELLVNDSTA